MRGYVKIFSKIIASSIWDQDAITCKVWITMLASADKEGVVQGTVRWLSLQSRTSIEDCQKALNTFLAPDPESTSKEYDGRRIEVLDDGWLILNYLKYRDMLSPNEKDSASRERVRKHRETYKALHALRNTNERYVTPGGVTEPAPAFASVSVLCTPKEGGVGEGKKVFTPPTIEEVKLGCAKAGLNDQDAEAFWHYWNNYDWKLNKGKGPKMKSFVSALITWRSNKGNYVKTSPESGQPANRIELSKCLERIEKELATLTDADLPKAIERRKFLKIEKAKLLEKLGLPA